MELHLGDGIVAAERGGTSYRRERECIKTGYQDRVSHHQTKSWTKSGLVDKVNATKSRPVPEMEAAPLLRGASQTRRAAMATIAGAFGLVLVALVATHQAGGPSALMQRFYLVPANRYAVRATPCRRLRAGLIGRAPPCRATKLNFIEGYLGDYPNQYEVRPVSKGRRFGPCTELSEAHPLSALSDPAHRSTRYLFALPDPLCIFCDRALRLATWAWEAISSSTPTSTRAWPRAMSEWAASSSSTPTSMRASRLATWCVPYCTPRHPLFALCGRDPCVAEPPNTLPVLPHRAWAASSSSTPTSMRASRLATWYAPC